MPRARVTMRKSSDILRLAWSCNQSRQYIAASCGVVFMSRTITFLSCIPKCVVPDDLRSADSKNCR